MLGIQRRVVTGLCAVCFLALSSASAAPGENSKVNGMIISRTGETLIVRNPDGNVTVVLTDSTQTKDDKGLFGLDKEYMSNVVLIPGLKVKIDGASDGQGRFVAKTITVDGDDLETSEMIQSGLHPTAEQVAANVLAIQGNKKSIAGNRQDIAANRRDIGANKQDIAAHQRDIGANKQDIAVHTRHIEQNMKDIQENTDRFTALSEYDVKGEATVKFKVRSSKLSPEDLEPLKQLAQTATSLTGYIIEIKGFADASGGAMMNEKLSEDRAKAVVSYFIQQCNVPVRHIVAPGAMGEYQPAASNETREGRAENRRVEVKVLVNKGISGK